MAKARDLSYAQYVAALKRRGFTLDGVLGYVSHRDNPNLHLPPVLKIVKGKVHINHRASLAYAIQRHDKEMRQRRAK